MISIVTITRNNYTELVDTLNSIKDIPQVESIVINGGTCGDTQRFLKNHAGVVVTEPDLGISDALNKGLKRSTGKGVMFLNSGDTLLQPAYLSVADQMLDTYDFIHSDIIFMDAIVGPMRMIPAQCTPGRGMPYFHQSMVVRKLLLDQVGLFNLNYKIAMDYDYVIRMHKLSARGYYFSEYPSIQMDGMGISATQEIKSLKESLRSLKENGVWNLRNRIGFAVRFFNYSIRRTLLALGLRPLLKALKQSKQKLRLFFRRSYE